jgi:probable HAF family extracellular repeat protein
MRRYSQHLALILGGILLTGGCGGSGGGNYAQTTTNAVPTISGLSPSSVMAGAAVQTLTINGRNFLSSSTVSYNGVAHVVSFVSSNQLTISLSASDQATAGSYPVIVTNPAPGGGSSLPAMFVVSALQGSLSVTVSGLPSGTSASVAVTGPNGYTAQLTASQTLQVVVGSYTVNGGPVGSGSSNYYPTLASQTVTVSSSVPASVTVDYSTIIPKSTKVLDSAGMSSLTVSSDGLTITLSTASSVATSLAAGNVLASGPAPAVPYGLLVKILSVSTSGQIVTASVQQATLEDAIQQATFEFSETLGPENTTSNIRTKIKRSSHPLVDRLLSKNSTTGVGACAGNSSTIQLPFNVKLAGGGTASLALSGEDDFCPSFSFQLQIKSFQVVSMTATATVGIHISIGLLDNVQGSFNNTQDLATFAAAPTVALIGGVPLVVQPTLTPFVGVSGNAAADAYTGLTTDSTLTIGVSYANGSWSPIDSSISPAVISSATSVDGQVGLKAFAGVRAGVVFDGFLTPNLSGDGYLQFNSSLTGNPCWSLNAGLEANLGVNVTVLGQTVAAYSSPALNLYSKPVLQATATCFAPTLSGITPNMAPVMGPQLLLTLTGSNFVPDSIVNFNGQPLATTFLDPSDLTAVVPAQAMLVGGTFPVTINDPDDPGGTSAPVTFTVATVTVSVSPTSASVPVCSTQQFLATVKGTSNTAVTWSVNGIGGGNSTVGRITAEGLYTAPTATPSPSNVTIMATSQANSSISASASITITTLLYGFVPINYPGAVATQAYSINNSGQIVGEYDNQSGGSHGFLYSGGNYTSIDYPGASSTQAYGINDSGQIVGDYSDPSGQDLHGFLYSGGNFSTIDYPGASSTVAFGMNVSGQIVGVYYDQAGNGPISFLYSGGNFSTIDYPSAFESQVYGINVSGQIVGTVTDHAGGSSVHGFLYVGGVFSLVDYPGASSTLAFGIDDNGQIVGIYIDPANVASTHGFLYSGGKFTSIDYPGTTYIEPHGVNDSGQIVGFYMDKQSFLATPSTGCSAP